MGSTLKTVLQKASNFLRMG